MVEACLRNRKHYTDITGEISVFEACAALDKRAQEAGIMIMPGVGFDVVPSDCLALHLKNRLPTATYLTLAFYGMGRLSHGTQATMTMNVGRGGAIRKDSKITPVPAGWKTREIDFGEVTKTGVTIPWGDVATAFYSTGIPNIEVYTIAPASALKMMKLSRYFGGLFATGPFQKYLQSKIPAGGPSDTERAKGRTLFWGEVRDAEGNRAQSLQTSTGGIHVDSDRRFEYRGKGFRWKFQDWVSNAGQSLRSRSCFGDRGRYASRRLAIRMSPKP
jgi:short subunit dehydrogenase-like uncharacterized protein